MDEINIREWDRAFVVRHLDDDEEPCVVVYASHERAAKYEGAKQLGGAEWRDLEVERRPELDEYWPGGPSIRTLIEKHGWHWSCSCPGCWCQVTADGCSRHEAQVPLLWSEDEGDVWCNAQCREQSERKMQELREQNLAQFAGRPTASLSAEQEGD